MVRKLIAALLVSSCVYAWAQAPAAPLVLIKAGKLFDARNGRMLTNQAILVEAHRIKEIGETAVVASHGSNAKTIDLTSATVLPGLIDCHAHILSDLNDWS